MAILTRSLSTLALLAALSSFSNAQSAFNSDQSILFLSNRSGSYEVYSMNPDGTSQRRLTFGVWNGTTPPRDVTSARWSPDGRKIVYSRIVDATSSVIVIANADGSAPVAIAAGENPSFRPDGQKIIFDRCVIDNCSLYTMNLDGTGETIIPIGQADSSEFFASFSPKGSRIVFFHWNFPPGGVFMHTSDPGGNNFQIFAWTDGIQPNFSVPALFSPDGGKILFTSNTGDVYTLNASTAVRFNVTNAPNLDTNGVWSPDGNSILYSRNVDASNSRVQLHRINSDGTGRVRLTNNAYSDYANDWRRASRAPIRTPFDFDGDGRADPAVFRPSNNRWYVRNEATGFSTITWGVDGDKLVPADYDGDLKTDIAIWRPSSGRWYIVNSATQTFEVTTWGEPDDAPLPADHDGDGKADLVIYRPSLGRWYVRKTSSAAAYNGAYTTFNWGTAADTPIIADFDGDRRADAAVFRSLTNTWYVRESYQNRLTSQAFGEAGDVPVPADYDDDGISDLAVWRPSSGQWIIKFSSNGLIGGSLWGVAGDKPVPADYDGDGQTDMAVFRPSNSTWYVASLGGSIMVRAFGTVGDLPIQNAYIP